MKMDDFDDIKDNNDDYFRYVMTVYRGMVTR